MTKWEYCHVQIASQETFFLTSDGLKIVKNYKDASKGDNSPQDATWRVIADLGQEGWELVNVEGPNWHFKRPIES